MFEVKKVGWDLYFNSFKDSSDWMIFDNVKYANLLHSEKIHYILNDENGVICGFALDVIGAEVTQLPIGFYPYNQILRHKSVTKNSKRSIDGEKFLIHSLVKKFGKFSFISSPKNPDIRSSLFLDYDHPEISVVVNLKYTASLAIGYEQALEGIRGNYKKRRKQAIKKAMNLNYLVSEKYSIGELKNMYVSTFARQGISVAQNELEKLSSIVDFAEKNHGYVVIVRDSKSVASAATVCLTDRDTAYSIFILNDADKIVDGCASLCVDAAIDRATSLGLSKFDFVGANSPVVDFKLSFGAQLEPYHVRVSIEN